MWILPFIAPTSLMQRACHTLVYKHSICAVESIHSFRSRSFHWRWSPHFDTRVVANILVNFGRNRAGLYRADQVELDRQASVTCALMDLSCPPYVLSIFMDRVRSCTLNTLTVQRNRFLSKSVMLRGLKTFSFNTVPQHGYRQSRLFCSSQHADPKPPESRH